LTKSEVKHPVLFGPLNANSNINQDKKRFWNIVVNDTDDEAEIIFYGEIVSARPTDWWSGEPVKGNFICPEEFLEDLKQVKDKSVIKLRINSVGGDYYTGKAIYSQLKSLKAKKIAIIDGICASAATFIAMAADVIQMPAGSTFMIHDALVFLYGYYNKAGLLELIKMLDSVALSAAETYSNKTKIPVEELLTMMREETWMTGREAVEKGFADELIFENEEISMQMSADRKHLIANGVEHSLLGFKNIPKNIPVVTNSATPRIVNIEQGGKKMFNTVEELRQAYPDLVNQIENNAKESGKNEGVVEERERIKSIDEIQNRIGDKNLVNESKYGDKICSAQELAFNFMKKDEAAGSDFQNARKEELKAANTDKVKASANSGNESEDPEGSVKNTDEVAIAMLAGITNKEVNKNA
jgi:ATP-dependent protease ClpP protease subunit